LCPECGAAWPEGMDCPQGFYQMLYWEAENPALGGVHHLMALCYHLQHPSLYSPEGLEAAKKLIHAFVVEGARPQEARRKLRGEVDSSRRKWKVTAAGERCAAHAAPVKWTMTAADVVAGGAGENAERVRGGR
jgi:hypothetical protein